MPILCGCVALSNRMIDVFNGWATFWTEYYYATESGLPIWGMPLFLGDHNLSNLSIDICVGGTIRGRSGASVFCAHL